VAGRHLQLAAGLLLGQHLQPLAADRHQLDDRRADQDAVAVLEVDLTDLLAIDEGAVGRAEVLDGHPLLVGQDLRVLARDHVLDQDHVQVGGTSDDDLPVGAQGELAALVLARDEAERPHDGVRPDSAGFGRQFVGGAGDAHKP
jgi:hypothetical protein